MTNNASDYVFRLVQSLTKAEKRLFKIYVSRTQRGETAKFVRLFDAMEQQTQYNEPALLEKLTDIKPSQLPNLKAHLYDEILHCLRMQSGQHDIDMQIREQIDFANVLYNKSLYEQSQVALTRAKEQARRYDRLLLLNEIIEYEKRTLVRSAGENLERRVHDLIQQSENVQQQISSVSRFANLSLRLYSFYLGIGFIRNHSDFEIASRFLYSMVPAYDENTLSFDERMHLYSAMSGYYFFIQDVPKAYEYAQKWVTLFDTQPQQIVPKIEMYIKAVNNLAVAQSKLNKYWDFVATLQKLDTISTMNNINITFNISITLFKYSYTHQINRFFMEGEFAEGVKIIPDIADKLESFAQRLEEHTKHIFYYKFACMYFGNDDYKRTVFWLNKIIHAPQIDLRSDVQAFARMLNLISHFEMNNIGQMEYFIRSTYRFLVKKKDYYQYQQYILQFLKRTPHITRSQLPGEFARLREQLLTLKSNPYEKRAFVYFDIVSWLESKIQNRPVQQIAREKALKNINNNKQVVSR